MKRTKLQLFRVVPGTQLEIFIVLLIGMLQAAPLSAAKSSGTVSSTRLQFVPDSALTNTEIAFDITLDNEASPVSHKWVRTVIDSGASFTYLSIPEYRKETIATNALHGSLDLFGAEFGTEEKFERAGNGLETPGNHGLKESLPFSAGVVVSGLLTNSQQWGDGHTELSQESPTQTPVGIAQPPSRLLFSEGFENGLMDRLQSVETDSSFKDYSRQIKTISYQARSGRYAVEVQINQNDPLWNNTSKYRAELIALPSMPIARGKSSDDVGISHDSPEGVTRWYAFSHFIPENWGIETDVRFLVVMQLWSKKDADENDEDQRVNSPVIGLEINRKNEYILYNRWDDAPYSKTPGRIPHSKRFKLGSITPGKWVDWVFRIHWAYNEKGSLEVWKNGDKVVNVKGRGICYNDNNGIKFKLGLYTGKDLNYFPKTILIDDIRVGDESATYIDMAPGFLDPGAIPEPTL